MKTHTHLSKQTYARSTIEAKEICFYLSNKCPIKFEWFGHSESGVSRLCAITADAWTHVVVDAMARKNTHPHTHPTLLLTISIVEGKKAISQKYGHLRLSASSAIVEWPLSFFQSQFHQNVNIRHFNLLVCFIIQSGKVSLNYVNNRENTVSDLAIFFFGEAEGRRRQDPINGGPFSFQIEIQFDSIHLKWNVEIERKKNQLVLAILSHGAHRHTHTERLEKFKL